MRVTQILYSGLGGHANVAFSLIDAEDSSLQHSLIFYGVEGMLIEYKKRCKENNIKYYYVRKKNGIDLFSWFVIIKALIKQKPNAILLHSVTAILPVFLYRLFKSIRLVSIEHTPNKSKRKIDWLISRSVNSLSDYTVVLTIEYKNELIEKLSITSSEKIVIIPNGIDLKVFSPGHSDKKQNYLLMVSRLSDTKDHVTLINAFERVVKEKKDLHLKIVGVGETMPELKTYVSQRNTRNVEFLGLKDEKEIVHLFRKSLIYKHSTHSEAMSTSIMQAMACGNAVIATNIAGMNNLIKDRKTGLLTPECNANTLSSIILKLCNDVPLRSYLSNNARKYAEENFSNTRMLNAYKKLMVK